MTGQKYPLHADVKNATGAQQGDGERMSVYDECVRDGRLLRAGRKNNGSGSGTWTSTRLETQINKSAALRFVYVRRL